MKKVPIIFVFISLAIIFGIFFASPFACVCAYADDETENNLDNVVDETLEKLDLSEYEEFLKELNLSNGEYTLIGLIKSVLNNNSEFDFKYFLNYSLGIFVGNLQSGIAQALLIVLTTVLLSILQNISSGFAKSSTKKLVYLACFGVIITVVGYLAGNAISTTQKTICMIEKFSSAVFPVLITLMTAIGATTTAAIYQPVILIFSVIIIKIINFIIMPLFYTCFVFNILGNLSDDLKLDKISKFAKSLADWIIGIVFSLFVTYITAQGITGASFDSLAARSAKYALSSYVPVVGGYLKDGFDIIVAGCIVIKNAIGTVSVFILILTIIVPIIKIGVTIFILRLTAAVTEPFGDKKISNMLFGVSKSLTILVVMTIALGFSILIVLTLIIASCNLGLI